MSAKGSVPWIARACTMLLCFYLPIDRSAQGLRDGPMHVAVLLRGCMHKSVMPYSRWPPLAQVDGVSETLFCSSGASDIFPGWLTCRQCWMV